MSREDCYVEVGRDLDFKYNQRFNVTVTTNGQQWYCIFTGTEKECDVIKEAFVKVGYKVSLGALFG